MPYPTRTLIIALALASLSVPGIGHAQDPALLAAEAGADRQTFIGKQLVFDSGGSVIPESATIEEIMWDFGDGISTTGPTVTHAYQKTGQYTTRLTISTDQGRSEDSTTVRVFAQVAVLIADEAAGPDELAAAVTAAADNGQLLLILTAQGSGPEVLTEEDLASQLLDAREAVGQATVLMSWTSGSVGANALSKFAQHGVLDDLALARKGIIILSDTPLAVLAPTAQTVFDQLQPAYVLLTRPAALPIALTEPNAEAIREAILTSQLEHRLLGSFSARTARDIGPTNFISFAISFLINRGVPIDSLILILMLPVIATILAFSRQVIGIKAFGLITPALTTLSFLVMGLVPGLTIFAVVLLAGTLTRLLMRRLQLLYLPRMALVLTSVSLAILLLLSVGALSHSISVLSFSIFPTLILTLLAEEFIAVQWRAGMRQALTITGWTLFLAIACYLIVSWELFRTALLSYPEVILLAIPANILLGRFAGLRLTEYFRFQSLRRYVS